MLAGSILGLDPDRARIEAAALNAAGDWIHVDIIDSCYPLRHGVAAATLDLLPESWWPGVDVHLMVGAPPADLAALNRAGRVTVHVASAADIRILDAVLTMRADAWVSLEPQRWSTADLCGLIESRPISGLLMMLATPALAGAAAEKARMSAPAWKAARNRLPLGVDGGVRADLLAALAEHGVGYFVVGRALFAEGASPIGPESG